MCVLAIALGMSERFPLAVAANRDERHARPTLAIHWWHDRPTIFGGRDLAASGGWLAVDRRGRLAAVTNVRDPAAGPAPLSRGRLVADFLDGEQSAEAFADAIEPHGGDYGPFYLLLYDGQTLLFTSNRAPRARLGPGVHAIGNAPPGTEWPKLPAIRDGLAAALRLEEPTPALLDLLARRGNGPAPEPESDIFVVGDVYGTRSSAVILVGADGVLSFTERRFGPGGVPEGDSRHAFALRD